MKRTTLFFFISTLIPCMVGLDAAPLLDFKQHEPSATDTSVYTFAFTLQHDGGRLIMDLDSDLEYGTLNILLTGGGYQVIGNFTNQGTFTYDNLVFGPLNNQEPVDVTITAIQASGDWHIAFREFSTEQGMIGLLISGILVIVISAGCMVWWKRTYGEPMKWIWIGGGIWAAGVALKFVFAFLCNEPILAGITSAFGSTGYTTIGSLYIGSLTGVFEIGITLLFAVLFTTMYRNPARAIGIGIGAGAIEALLIGFSQIGNIAFLLSGRPETSTLIVSLAQTIQNNPVFFLLAPVERMITILCHTSSRVLTLYAAARRKYIYFWAGFLLMTLIDAIAGYIHLTGLVNRVTLWWVELALVPFAIISIPIIQWCVRGWPQQTIEDQGTSDKLK